MAGLLLLNGGMIDAKSSRVQAALAQDDGGLRQLMKEQEELDQRKVEVNQKMLWAHIEEHEQGRKKKEEEKKRRVEEDARATRDAVHKLMFSEADEGIRGYRSKILENLGTPAFVPPSEPVVAAAPDAYNQGQGSNVAPSSEQITNGSEEPKSQHPKHVDVTPPFGRGAPPNKPWDDAPLCEGARAGDLGRVTKLLAKGTDPNTVTVPLTPPLVTACVEGHHLIVAQLLEYGADPFVVNGRRCSLQSSCDQMVLKFLAGEGRCANCGMHLRSHTDCQ
jgi:hypothetical protein